MIKQAGLKNISALYIAKFAEFVVPWVYLPLLLRVIGPELFGILALATAVTQYITIAAEFGYPFSGVRTVTVVRNDSTALDEFVSRAVHLRLAASGISVVALVSIVMVMDLLPSTRFVFAATSLSAFGVAATPQFVFQGLEKFRPYLRVTTTLRLASAGLIVVLVRTPSDFILVPVIHTTAALLTGMIASFILMPAYGVRIRRIPLKSLANEYRCQKNLLLSGVAISLYTATNTVVLGLFSSPAVVGYYAAAEKLVRALQQLFSPVQTLLMPQVAREAQEAPAGVLVRLVRLLGGLTLFVLPVSVLLMLFASEVVTVAFGSDFLPSAAVVRILGPLPFIMICTLVCTDLFLLGFGHIEAWRSIINWSALAGVVMAFISAAALNLGAVGMAVVLVITEGMIVIRSADYFIRAIKARVA